MLDLKETIKNAQSGDDSAFSTLIKLNKEKLYKTAYLYVKNEEEALDILSDAVCKAYLNIKKLKEPEFFNTWIMRILINTASDTLKKKKRLRYIDDYEKFKIVDEKFCSTIAEKVDLYKAIDCLNINYKNIIILKFFEDMTIKEISTVLKRPEGTIKVYLSRAIKKLKIELKEDLI